MIALTAAQLAFLADAAEEAFPAECCGLLVGTGRRNITVTRLIPAPNLLAAETTDRFELDPRIRFEAERALRGSPERVIGHWHSHPNGSAIPSPTDLDQAWEPELIWLILGVTLNSSGHPQTVQTLAHRLDRSLGRSRPIPLRLNKNSACMAQGFPT
jgi:proteasome lid subunit RPN8/RPN11